MAVHNPFHHTHGATVAMLLPAAELGVMRVLWAQGPLTVREIHEAVFAERPVAYTTVLTTCVRLFEKGLLAREGGCRGVGYVYIPIVDERTFVTTAVKQL